MPSILLVIILLVFTINCEADDTEQPPKVGNFALPTSQQPGPLVSFGENIIDKNETQLFLFADDYSGVNEHYIDLVPAILYGITNNLSIFINAPYAPSYKMGQHESSGFEDAFAQLEYAFYNKSSSSYVDQATIVANVSAPTGSAQKKPPTGVGALSYFLGATYNRTSVDWFIFGSPGAVITSVNNGTKFGNSYLYQFGFGRNIANINGWLLAWMTEIDGTYSQRNIINGVTDSNSGGNIVYITPSIWASTKKFLFQFGVGFPATQNLYGNQPKETFLFAANVGWSIY